MTIDQPVATRLEGRSLAWRLGASATLAIATVLLAWAVTVDFTKVSYGFFSDGATYYSLAHSLAQDGDFEYRREDLVRVWREFRAGRRASSSRRAATSTSRSAAASVRTGGDAGGS